MFAIARNLGLLPSRSLVLGLVISITSLYAPIVPKDMLCAQDRGTVDASDAAVEQFLFILRANAAQMESRPPESVDSAFEIGCDDTRPAQERARALASIALVIDAGDVPVERLRQMVLDREESSLVQEQCVLLAGKALLDKEASNSAERLMYSVFRSNEVGLTARRHSLFVLSLLGESNNCFLREVTRVIGDPGVSDELLENIAEVLFTNAVLNRSSIDAVLNAILLGYNASNNAQGRKLQLMNAVSLLERHADYVGNGEAVIDPQTAHHIELLAQREFVSNNNLESVRVLAATFLYDSSSLTEDTIRTAESLVSDDTLSNSLRESAALVAREGRRASLQN